MNCRLMNIGQAIDWLLAHTGKHLRCRDNGRQGFEFDVRIAGCRLQMRPDMAWSDLEPGFGFNYEFWVPERKLPKLPDGDSWFRDCEGRLSITTSEKTQMILVTQDGLSFAKKQAQRYLALVEEYESREPL